MIKLPTKWTSLFVISLIVLLQTYSLYSQKKPNVAVTEFSGRNVSAMDAAAMSDLLRTELVNTGKFTVVDRGNMEQILAEHKIQLSCATQECAVKIGNLLNAQKVVVGKVMKVGNRYIINASMVDVETGKILKSGKVKSDSIEDLTDKVEELARTLAGMTSGMEKETPEFKEQLEEFLANFVPITNKIDTISGLPMEIRCERDGSEMVLVPAGEFLMGSPAGEGDKDEYPQHKVYLDAYYIDKYEVTNEQYAKFLNAYGKDTNDYNCKMIFKYKWGVKKVDGRWLPSSGYEKYPVVCVTLYGASQYARYYGKRLPTEAEWEKACRAGSNTKYCFRDNESELGDYAWYKKNSGKGTNPAGQKKPNVWGIYDMHGNVWEWCSDWYHKSYYKSSPANNPEGHSSGKYVVLRGGSWKVIANNCRAALRHRIHAVLPYNSNGFRSSL